MTSLNKVLLLGHLGADPEMAYTADSRARCTFRMATSERFTNRTSGETTERTEWHRVVVWGAPAEACGAYLKTGRAVFVEGRLHYRSWDNEGQRHFSAEIVADRVQFLGHGRGEGEGDVDHEG